MDNDVLFITTIGVVLCTTGLCFECTNKRRSGQLTFWITLLILNVMLWTINLFEYIVKL